MQKSPVKQIFEILTFSEVAEELDVSRQAVCEYDQIDRIPQSRITAIVGLYNKAVKELNRVRKPEYKIELLKLDDVILYCHIRRKRVR